MRRLLHLTILCLFTTVSAFAQNRYWVGTAANGNWHDAANWSLTSGGPGGATVPGVDPGLVAIFDNQSRAAAQINLPITDLAGLSVFSNYIGSITQSQPITINGTFRYNGGTFTSAAPITVNGNYTQAGGNFISTHTGASVVTGPFDLLTGSFNPGPGTLTINGNVLISNPSSLVAPAGTVVFDGTTSSTLTVNLSNPGSVRFNNVIINKSSADDTENNFSLATGDVLVVGGNLTLTNGNLANGNSIIQVEGNATVASTFDGALGGDLVFTGAGNSVATFDAPFGTTLTSDVIVNKTSPTATVSFVTGLPSNTIVTGTNSTGSFSVISGTANFPDNDIVNHVTSISIGAQGTYVASGNTTTSTNNFSNSGTFNGNGGTFVFGGTTNSTFSTAGAANGTTTFSNVILNKTTTNGNLIISNGDVLAADGNMQLNSGTIFVNNGATNGPGFIQANGNLSTAAAFVATSQYVGLNFGGANAQTINLAAGTQSHFNGPIQLAKTGGTATLASTFLVDFPGQIMTFTSGTITTTTANILSFGPTSVAAVGNGYVDGPVRKIGNTAFTFPTGDGGFSAPVRMSGNAGFNDAFAGGSKTFIAEYFHTSPGPLYPRDQIQPPVDPSLKVSQQEYWRVGQVGAVPIAERPFLWFSYENARSGGLTDIDAVGIAAWLGSDVWSQFGNGGLASNSGFDYLRSGSRNLTTNEIDPVFTFITDDSIANPLPVTWLGFTGRYYNAVVELNWSTSLELNNATFTVERSGDGDKYQSIGTIPGRGTVNSTSYYSFIDKEPVPGVNHYRIKQTDIDGKFSYSKEIRVSTAELGQNGLRLFPNPMTASLPLVLENADWKNQKVTVTIYNATGGIVQQQQVTFGADSRSRLDLSRLKKGSYFITTTLADGKKQTLSFIVQ